MNRALLLLRGFAIAAAVTWLIYCWRGATGRESPQAEEIRTGAFVLGLICAALGWPTKPRKPGGRYKERL